MSMDTLELKVPSVGESVSEVEVGEWLKKEGEAVAQDESVVVLETDKATMEVPSPAAGRLAEVLKKRGEKVVVGDVLARIAPAGAAPSSASSAGPAEPAAQPAPKASPPGSSAGRPPAARASKQQASARVMPAAARLAAEKGIPTATVPPSGPGGRILKEDVQRAAPVQPTPDGPSGGGPTSTVPPAGAEERSEEIVPMTLLRRKIAERLVRAQQEAAHLTTFNEIDMSSVRALRQEQQERFQARYQIKLGLMSFFVKAAIEGLKQTPQLNAEVRGTDIVYRNYFDIGIAIGGGKGLVVPVLRNAERMSFAEIELAVAEFAQRVKENRIKPDDLAGGTFTITNGGVYGSLLSTPIINPPQSGVLGMHAIQERPVALNGQVVVRPMMYVALSYDHRIVDGREAVTFLRRVKELVENPVRILIEV